MTKPTKSPREASQALEKLIEDFQPDVVVTEGVSGSTNGVHALRRALARCASSQLVLDVSIRREQVYANKYEEAASLANAYPELKPWVPPKRRFFDNEPPRMILLAAASLAHAVLRQPTLQLATAMR